MAPDNKRRSTQPGTAANGEAAAQQTTGPGLDGIANDGGLSEERPHADPEIPALGDWDKRSHGSSAEPPPTSGPERTPGSAEGERNPDEQST
jgi:hypothetical protein